MSLFSSYVGLKSAILGEKISSNNQMEFTGGHEYCFFIGVSLSLPIKGVDLVYRTEKTLLFATMASGLHLRVAEWKKTTRLPRRRSYADPVSIRISDCKY